MEQTTVLGSWDNSTSKEEISTRTLHQVGAPLVATLGFIANTLILIAVLKAKLYRQNVILFVLNLVINNALVCATSLPYIAVMAFSYSGEVNLALCQFMGYITYSIIASELLGLNLVAINRYFLIVRYRTYLEIYNKKKNIAIMIALSWIVYPVLMVFPATNVWGSMSYDRYKFLCHPFKANDSFGKFLAGFALLTTVPLIIFGYISILPKVFKTNQQVNLTRSNDKPRKREVRLVSLVIVLLSTFCFMYLPFAIMSIIDPTTSLYDPKIHISFVYVAWAHCLVNPLLYAVMNRQIRRAIKDLFLVPGGKNAVSGITTVNHSRTDLTTNDTGL
ncbi:G-protein coupled receptor moody-like isoform X2 [Mizuhopecten yessoensis]|uniref:Protein trapped in endoderm-1 n=1 Tax=Mizuhopecten yessoensis TaxID=6573 RepID=A0A210Q397_MIZYE|nr:G-protein coupled receptor moody-like isoform X1 [Mizuhopecten yessoensis]XP_021368329.1 G-protein coupled receptor moody-like isoform X2 [Mizuhopecten yessoensis]OWF43214.1 Protein trapped in endoderm-1 [Mizuhopecten yessoensis]